MRSFIGIIAPVVVSYLETRPKAFAFVQRCTTNDVAALTDGKVQYTCLPNGKGGIVDDMLVYRVAADEYFMVPNAANIDKDWAWMAAIAQEMGMELGVEFVNESDQWSQLAVQGPLALKAMQKLTATTVEDMEYYTFKILEFAGVKDVIFSTTGYTGSGGCEIYMPNDKAIEIYKKVLEAGALPKYIPMMDQVFPTLYRECVSVA